MARVTVEDCLKNVDNRFELVLIASKRARQLAREGASPFVPWDNDKVTVVALREVAEGFVTGAAFTAKKPPQALLQTDAEEISSEIIEETQTFADDTAPSETAVDVEGNE